MTNEPINMTATNDRRILELRNMTPFVMPDRKARRLPPKNRRHSVKHRAIR